MREQNMKQTLYKYLITINYLLHSIIISL